MSKKFLTNIDLGGNQLLNGRLHNNSTDPTPLGASAGQIYYNSSTGTIKYFNGTASAWATLTAGGAVSSVNGFSGTVNIVGTASHISVTNSSSVVLDLDPSVVFTASTQTLTNKTLSSGSLTGTITSTASISGGSATSLVIGSSSIVGTLVGTGATISGATLSGGTLSGTTTNSGSISGGSATSLVLGTASLVGTLTNTASITGGSATSIVIGSSSLTGGITATNATVSGGTFSGVTLSGTTTNSSSISGGSATNLVLGTASLVGTLTNTASITGGSATSIVIGSSSITGGITATNATVSGGTFSGITLSGTTTNSSSISGGSATNLVLGTASLVGTLTSTASISGGSVTSGTFGNGTITGGITSSNATFTGGTFSGVTLSGTTTNSSSISGGSATNLVIGTASLVGTLTSTASISGGSFVGGTLGNTTLSGSITGGSVTGTVHNSGSLTGTIVNTASIGGGTLNPTTFQINGVGATSVNTNNAPVIRDAAGRAQMTDPAAAQDIATKNYVDTVAQGLNTRDAVGYATTALLANGVYAAGAADGSGGTGIGATISSSVNGTLTVDGTVVTVNDRILVKNQTTQTQNGIYYVSASGSGAAPWVLTRANDADNSISGELGYGDYWFVQNGSTNANTGWVQTTKGTGTGVANSIKIGTDNITFAQFMQASSYTGASGVNVAGTVISFAPLASGGLQTAAGGASILKPTNSGLVIDATGLYIGAGTGFTLSTNTLNYASGSTANSGQVSNAPYSYATQKQYATITGDNATTSFTVNHNLGSRDVNVQVYQTSAGPDTQYAEVEVDIVRTSTSAIAVSFAVAPSNTSTYNVVLVG